jgi:hypothetical protein
MPRQPEPIEHVEGPVAAARVEALCRRGVGPLIRQFARQQPVKKIGNHEQPIGCSQQGRMPSFQREQLIERVQFHELQAGGRKDLVAWHDRIRGREHPLRAGIPIADRIGQECGVGRQK